MPENLLNAKSSFIKTAKSKVLDDDLRPEYKRTDFGIMERGKYAAKTRATLKIAVLEPEIAKAFPTSEAVNDAIDANNCERSKARDKSAQAHARSSVIAPPNTQHGQD